MTNPISLLQGDSIDIDTFVNKYQQLDEAQKNEVLEELSDSLRYLQTGYDDLLETLQGVKQFIGIQQNIIESLKLKGNQNIFHYEIPTENQNLDSYHNDVQLFNDTEDEVETKELIESKKSRGRTPLIQDLIEHFNLTEKAIGLEEEAERLKNLQNYNNWVNIGTSRTPHKVVKNGTYLASVQMLEANSKNANYSVLTRVMLNPTGAFFQGESVIIRNRYLENKDEAHDYMNRQIKKLTKQFFYDKSPIVIQNHGNRNSYYGFHLSKENRDNYKKALQLSE